jgi:hypothetical protein
MRRVATVITVAALAACGGADEVTVDAILVGPPPDAAPPPPDAEPGHPCDMNLPCPSASTGHVTICGRLRDVATGEGIWASSPTLQRCGEGGAADGACALSITPYDALDYAGDPTGATPLSVDTLALDDCGRFILRNVDRPQLGYVAIVVDDDEGEPDARRATARVVPTSSGEVRTGLAAYSLAAATDAAWTAQAGLDGATFADRGAALVIVRDGESAPVAGVTLSTGLGGATAPLYFADDDPDHRATIDPTRTATGANGAALLRDGVEHTVAPAPADCPWPTVLAGSIPGVLVVAEVWPSCAP